MSAQPLLPSEEEIDRIVLGPDSLVWQRFGDMRLFFASGYALLLQVAHPTVGSGVRDHSDFDKDPWGRLLRTTDYLFLLVYGGREAAEVGRRLREMHKTIKGENPDGSRYHALEPEAYAWVHATLIDGAVRAHERFVGRLQPGEAERFYAEYRPLGRLLGIRERDMPDDWASFRDYFDTMVEETLVHHETVDRVLATMRKPISPPVSPVLDPLWKVARVAPSRALRTATEGLLPPVLRARFGIPWKRPRQLELRMLGAASRGAGPLMPKRMKHAGPAYLRWRAKEIARGPFGQAGGGEDQVRDLTALSA